MRLNSTVVLTLVLLVLMVGAGLTSATWGYKLGREALKGITQPDARPVNNLTDSQGKPVRRDSVTFSQRRPDSEGCEGENGRRQMTA